MRSSDPGYQVTSPGYRGHKLQRGLIFSITRSRVGSLQVRRNKKLIPGFHLQPPSTHQDNFVINSPGQISENCFYEHDFCIKIEIWADPWPSNVHISRVWAEQQGTSQLHIYIHHVCSLLTDHQLCLIFPFDLMFIGLSFRQFFIWFLFPFHKIRA